MKRFCICIAAALICLTSSIAMAASETSLLPNGNFEQANAAGDWPDKWPRPDGGTWGQEEGNRFLRLQVKEPGTAVLVYCAVPMKSEFKAFDLSYRVRYTDIKPGKQPWFDGRIMMNFKDAAGTVVKGAPGAPTFRGTASDWKERTLRINVPEGASILEIMFTLFQAQSGTLDFDDVRLVPVQPATAPAK